ncbi:MAG: ATP-NAD kinase, partial [Acidimicrobiales bacterium]|nr:ATP-NAD kinase [Acidimicrobiales bacterium]
MLPLGLLVNPRSGKDVRRVVAAAATSTLEDKISIIRRVIQGAQTAGVTNVVTNREPHRLVERAVGNRSDIEVEYLGADLAGNETDSIVVAGGLRDAGCPAVVVLGGDGTNRAVALGWPDVPVVPLSTGTNNAFPYYVEPTVAGAAAGLIVTESIDRDSVATRAKVVRIEHRTGGAIERDVALIDAVAVDDPYV